MSPSSRDSERLSRSGFFLKTASEVVLSLVDIDVLLGSIMDRVIEDTHATKGYIILVTPGGDLEFRVARNMQRSEIDNPRNRISRTLIERVVATGETVMTGHAQSDPRFEDTESVHNLLLKSILCVPLRSEGAVGGVIYLENHITAGVFTDEMREMVERIAREASPAVGVSSTFAAVRDERDRLERENRALREVTDDLSRRSLIGSSAEMARVARQVEVIGRTLHTVLVRGESGTGKELVARLVHAQSPRHGKPFVAVACPAILPTLFESELFGHARGAFTGADRSRAGRVEEAEGGTLFLDEVGDLPLEVQPKLLRLLEERTYERVGESHTRRADVRIVAATHWDLGRLVEKGRFRADLFYRLGQLLLALPPLRHRVGDVRELALAFLKRERPDVPGFTPEAYGILEGHAWPGNVRELRNVVLAVATFAGGSEPIGADEVRVALEERAARGSDPSPGRTTVSMPPDEDYATAVRRFEQAWFRAQIESHPELSRTELAEKIGVGRRTLFQRLRDLGITGPEEQ